MLCSTVPQYRSRAWQALQQRPGCCCRRPLTSAPNRPPIVAAHEPPLATHVMLYHAAFLFVLAVNLPLIILTARGKGGNRKGAVVGRGGDAPAGSGAGGRRQPRMYVGRGQRYMYGDLRRTGPACVD